MYQFRNVVIKNGPHEHKSLVIEFTDPKMNIVGEFLMADARLLNYEVLQLIDHVLSGNTNEEKMNGNRCSLTITAEKTLIEDLFIDMFDGFQTHPAYTIDTKLLKDLIMMWRQKTQNNQ